MKKYLLFYLSCWFSYSVLLAQDRTITGQVTTVENGTGLPGVNVVVKDQNTGTVTDIDGNYTVGVPEEGAILIFSFIGYQTQEIPVGNSNVINIVMAEDHTELEEVVVTGYSTQQKRDVTGAITSVAPEKFKEVAATGIDQALQGQAPGVMVTKSSGMPGGGIMIRVRGNSSISASNQPLFIVDGVPVRSGRLTSRSFGGQGDNALATLNPNDIESIEILKDASAKAIYGARAANGVVLITTKKGRAEEKTEFNIGIQRGLSELANKLEVLNSTQLLTLQREALANAEQNPDEAGVFGITDAVDTDWIDEVSRTAVVEDYQLSARGGNEKTQFYLSGGYRNEEGVQLNNRFRRLTGTMNIDHAATDKLTFGVNLLLARAFNQLVKGDNFLDGVYSGAVKSLPYYQPYKEDGTLYVPGDIGYAGFPNFNPVAQALKPRFDTYTTRITGGIYGEYAFLPSLKLRSKVSIDHTDVKEDQYEPTSTAIGGFLFENGYGVYSTSEGGTLNITNTLSYNTSLFGDRHDVSVLLGNEVVSSKGWGSNVQGIQFPRDEFTYLVSAGLILDGSSSFSESGLVSYFTGVNYDYQGKYLLSFNARVDGSSRFGANRKYGFFPAASIGWRISDEPFMQNFSNVDELKLRVSYGFVGNQSIPNFAYLGTWAASTAYNLIPALSPATLANPELQWEQTGELNLGADLSLGGGKIQLSLDAYNNTTTDLLLSEPLPLTTGFSSVQGNLGKVVNQGLELALSTVNVDGLMQWRTDFNISTNRNEVKAIASDEPLYFGYQTFSNNTHVVAPGYPLGTFWGLRFLGVDPATGDAMYEDIDNDGEITADDGQVIGNAQPDFIGGLTNTFRYKAFDVSVFFQYSIGNQIINFTNQGMLNSGESLQDNQVVEALERWQKPGDITDVPRYLAGNTENNRFSSRFVEDASYIRLKNLSVGYNLPSSWLSRVKLTNVRIYASGTNVITFTNYSGADPEVNTLDGSTTSQGMDFYTFPQVKTWMLGVNVGF